MPCNFFFKNKGKNKKSHVANFLVKIEAYSKTNNFFIKKAEGFFFRKVI